MSKKLTTYRQDSVLVHLQQAPTMDVLFSVMWDARHLQAAASTRRRWASAAELRAEEIASAPPLQFERVSVADSGMCEILKEGDVQAMQKNVDRFHEKFPDAFTHENPS